MRKWIIVLLLSLMLTGCGSREQTQSSLALENAEVFLVEEITAFPVWNAADRETAQRGYEELYTDFGKFYSLQEEDHSAYILTFSDYASGTHYPLCPRTNCRHDSSDCGAYFSFSEGSPNFLYYDGEALCFFTQSDMSLYRQLLDGSGRERVTDLSQDVFAVNTILYERDTAWLLCERMDQNEDQSGYTIRKTILRLDLRSGAWEELPCAFEEDMSNVELFGKYGDELLLRHIRSTGLLPWQDPEETVSTIFLLHTGTGVITVLTQYEYIYGASAICPGYLICCLFDPDSEYEVLYGDEPWPAFSGELCIFDLEKRVCYQMESDCLTWEFSIRDGKLFYCQPGADGKTLEGKIRDLETGEILEWIFFDAEPRIRWLEDTETEEHFLVICEEQICRITKVDYYAGNRNLIPIP